MSNQIPIGNLGADQSNTFKGQQALYGHVESGANRALYRRHLAKAFGNLHNSGLKSSPSLYNKNILGPFRTSTNAGDVITNKIETTDPKYGRESSQVGGNNLRRLQVGGDGVSQTGNAMYSGNPRFVYDGSDYTRFKKLQAINKNYKDYSFGGNNSNNNQSIIRRMRN
tara:strand:+ start:23 stop:526 length:504 start_codon:yes stop_codon:yes gene_type:complete